MRLIFRETICQIPVTHFQEAAIEFNSCINLGRTVVLIIIGLHIMEDDPFLHDLGPVLPSNIIV